MVVALEILSLRPNQKRRDEFQSYVGNNLLTALLGSRMKMVATWRLDFGSL